MSFFVVPDSYYAVWNVVKFRIRRINLAKHGVDFAEVELFDCDGALTCGSNFVPARLPFR